MGNQRYKNFDQFRNELLSGRSGPMASAVEDMADEMYHQEIQEEFDSLWDTYDEED